MAKVLVFLSFVVLGFFVMVTALYPTSSVLWLTSTSTPYNYSRLVIMAVLLFMLFTTPPRNTLLRWTIGYGSIALASWSILNTYNNNIQLLDGMTYLLAAISTGTAALEYFPEQRINWLRLFRGIHLPSVPHVYFHTHRNVSSTSRITVQPKHKPLRA